MGYTKTQWNSGAAPEISATLLNKIEQGIYDAQLNSVHYDENEISDYDVLIDADRLNGHDYTYFAQASALNTLATEVSTNSNARHTHSNKNILDIITQAMIDAIGTIANKYVKPTGGIPKTDLDAIVQASLDKADNSLQEYNIIYTVEE